MKEEDKFCPHCGAAQQKKSRKALWITLISVAAVFIAAAAVYFFFFRNAVPLLSLGRAFDNLSTETEERFNYTPLKALDMLSDVLEDGSVTVNFDYTTALFGSFLTTSIDGSVKLSSITETRDFALEAQVSAYGQSIDLEAYMNKERLALRVPLIDDAFYGIKYETFRDDIRVFGRLIGLDNETMESLANYVDQLNELLNAEETDEEFTEPYTEVFSGFIRNLEITSRRTHIGSDGERIRCTSIEFRITKDALIELFNDIYDILENDEEMRSQFQRITSTTEWGTDFGTDWGLTPDNNSDYDAFLKDIKDSIDDFQKYYSGDILLVFFVSRDDRLLKAVINADTEYDGESSAINATFDFGNSIEDDWSLMLELKTESSNDKLLMRWSYDQQPGRFINTVEISTFDLNYYTFISEWEEEGSRFKLVYIDGWERNELTGVFIADDENFVITLDNVLADDSNSSLTLEILAVTGAQIKDIEYIKVDKWGTSIFEAISRLLMNGFLF